MKGFPLTRRKLLLQPKARRHKLVCQWLKSLYIELLNQPFGNFNGSHFKANYTLILTWLDEQLPSLDQLQTQRHTLEFVSERYHYHKKLTGLGLSEHNLLPNVKTGDINIDLPWQPSINYKVALDNLRSAFNVGSIFRLVDAAGFESVIIGGSTPGADHQQIKKTAMGCTKWIPQEKTEDFANYLNQQKAAGYMIIGLETVVNSCNHLEFDWPERGILVLGNEEYGISEDVLRVCDSFVHLPMQGRKNSINVANAFAIVAFQIAFGQNRL